MGDDGASVEEEAFDADGKEAISEGAVVEQIEIGIGQTFGLEDRRADGSAVEDGRESEGEVGSDVESGGRDIGAGEERDGAITVVGRHAPMEADAEPCCAFGFGRQVAKPPEHLTFLGPVEGVSGERDVLSLSGQGGEKDGVFDRDGEQVLVADDVIGLVAGADALRASDGENELADWGGNRGWGGEPGIEEDTIAHGVAQASGVLYGVIRAGGIAPPVAASVDLNARAVVAHPECIASDPVVSERGERVGVGPHGVGCAVGKARVKKRGASGAEIEERLAARPTILKGAVTEDRQTGAPDVHTLPRGGDLADAGEGDGRHDIAARVEDASDGEPGVGLKLELGAGREREDLSSIDV